MNKKYYLCSLYVINWKNKGHQLSLRVYITNIYVSDVNLWALRLGIYFIKKRSLMLYSFLEIYKRIKCEYYLYLLYIINWESKGHQLSVRVYITNTNMYKIYGL